MSVVVRMEMPSRCCDCDMADGVTCMATGGVYGREVPKMTWIRRRPDWCPIICQLPEEHGDLISRNAVAIACPGHIRIEDGEYWIRLSRVRESIKSAPTIVPAERSEL